MLRYLAALLLVPLFDALFLVLVATWIGAPLTVLIVVLTGLVGMLLVRAEGRHTLAKIQRKLATGEVPTDELLDGALLLVAGAFMLTPGLVTDFLGLVLIVPVTRWPIRKLIRERVVVSYVDEKTGGFASGNVYVGGFPFDDADDSGGPGGLGGLGGPGGPGGPGQGPDSGADAGAGDSDPFDPFGQQGGRESDTVDLDDDAYDIDVDGDDERGN
ncbi:MAG: FxsA family protein [Haloarculaceae archaeon]